jgi:hypothetical protein
MVPLMLCWTMPEASWLAERWQMSTARRSHRWEGVEWRAGMEGYNGVMAVVQPALHIFVKSY